MQGKIPGGDEQEGVERVGHLRPRHHASAAPKGGVGGEQAAPRVRVHRRQDRGGEGGGGGRGWSGFVGMGRTEGVERVGHLRPLHHAGGRRRPGGRPNRWRREYGFTDGKIIVRGKLVARGKRKRVDYLLFHKPNLPIALDRGQGQQPLGRRGMQQALAYAEMLDVPFVFSSNGDGFLFHDRTGHVRRGRADALTLDEFPSPDELWARYRQWKGLDDADEDARHAARTTPTAGGKEPRYYQQLAINRTVEAVARGPATACCSSMATGTGKTYTAFQIIWRLWKAGTVKRILFLADRNILVDQTIDERLQARSAA